MPRFEFSSWIYFKDWLEVQIKKYSKGYKLYVTDNQEVVAIPITSTRPLEYGYYRFEDETDENIKQESFIELVNKLAEKLRLDLFRVQEVVWNPEREPRVRSEE